MHEVHLQLPEQVYHEAQRRAVEAGFASVGEYIVDMVSEEVEQETENLDHLFTPDVIADLDRIRAAVQAGAKTYTSEEVDEFFRQKSKAWREAHGN
jgi:hypothetical protein